MQLHMAKRRSGRSSKNVVPCDSARSYSLAPPGRLPIEIWVEIIREYSKNKEWLALCKTSRFLYQVARICLYKRLDFDSRYNPSGPLALFEKVLQAQPELSTLIHDLSLRIYPKHKTRFSPRALMSKIDQLHNLERLVIRDSGVTAEIRDAIYSRPRLKVLEFDQCILDHSILTPPPEDYPRSSIVDLKILTYHYSPCVLGDLWVTFAPAGLQTLHLKTRFEPDSDVILLSIKASLTANMLEKLIIHCIPSCFIQFLVSSPRLRHLVIHTMFGVGDPRPLSSLPGDAIPLLEHYDGPSRISPIFIRNRPVQSVKLTHMGQMDKSECAVTLDSLQLSSVPVTSLRLTWPYILDKRLLSHLPITTHHLEFCINNQDPEKLILPDLSHLADLCTIRIVPRVPSTSTSFSLEEILKVSENLSSLHEIDILWNEIWRMTEPNVWEKFEHVIKVVAWG